MSIWDKCWFCEDFDEENDCCTYCVHPDDCEKVDFDAEVALDKLMEDNKDVLIRSKNR